ncbi:uncharacterized protein LOC133366316 isoform X6 [Rhineura floridana]|uniref:uncharacterized protein LOC133366316 isoform X6 n=1 Tax=Rhineura floridana TaxID=261503 RepID=UPI002AC84F6C|nr:uncharacterized protein LOC133366316 isoform X6 [Rhineura floridana]
MIWCHAIPDSSVVFLLVLLFFTPSEPGKDCNFMYPQLHSIDSIEHFSHVIEELKQYLLLDYPVSVPSNLKLDEFCQELWELHLIHSKLTSMMRVSGSSLRKMFLNITTHTNFIEGCKIEVSLSLYYRLFYYTSHPKLCTDARENPVVSANPTWKVLLGAVSTSHSLFLPSPYCETSMQRTISETPKVSGNCRLSLRSTFLQYSGKDSHLIFRHNL